MSYLKQLNVNEIKIDRLFVKGVEEATYNYRLISNMIEFAKSNAIRICCEGVEDVKELTVLEGLAPNLIQGYLFQNHADRKNLNVPLLTVIQKTTGSMRHLSKRYIITRIRCMSYILIPRIF